MSERSKRLKWNTISSIALQLTTVVCGFILPRLILGTFGSEVNGLVNSISQFLSVITFLELGVGAVVQSALYKPLAVGDTKRISEIVRSATDFFRKLARILLVYIIVLMMVYPAISGRGFGYPYTSSLIAIISISLFAQYYFGIPNIILLTADQKGYIHYIAQIIAVILNTFLCWGLIRLGAGIHIVKLTTSIIFFIRPLVVYRYVNSHYQIDRHIIITDEPIKQKWNGVAQHIAAFVLDGTDVMVLTLFSTLSNVSIYSVYHSVIYGIKQLIISMTNGIQSVFGELWARNDKDELRNFFSWIEWIIHTVSIYAFGCVATLIIPFVRVYTHGVNDANYIVPVFAIIITIAHMSHCLRLPYQMMILACNRFKETQRDYIASALINLIISIITVCFWGLIGVAIGTLIAMIHQTIWMVLYNHKHLLKLPLKQFGKQILVDATVFCIGYGIGLLISLKELTFLSWFVMAIEVAFLWGIIVLGVNILFYKDNVMRVASMLFHAGKR